jgi:hypothetical protein
MCVLATSSFKNVIAQSTCNLPRLAEVVRLAKPPSHGCCTVNFLPSPDYYSVTALAHLPLIFA